MKSVKQIEEKLKELKPLLSRKYNVKRIGYFGSYSRNEQEKGSDIDILVEFREPLGWEFFDLKELLEEELQLTVDLVSVNALKKELEKPILEQTRYV